ncbi:MAG: hypothetical protein ACI8R4_003648, partial [Paracoccaceae bacterium]
MAEKNLNGVGALGIGAVFEGDLTPTVFTGTINWFGSAWIGNTPNGPDLDYDFTVSGLSIASADIFTPNNSNAPILVPSGLRSALAGTDFVVNGSDTDDVFGPTLGFSLSGDHTIRGLRGNDRLSGGKSDDQLFGGAGRDFLSGRKGSDHLKGGSGNDTLSGGHGSDRFVFVAGDASGEDVVTDFRRAEDKLKFHGPIEFDNLTIKQQNSDTAISGDEGSVTLQGISAPIGEYPKLCVWGLAHAVKTGHLLNRSGYKIANWFRAATHSLT